MAQDISPGTRIHVKVVKQPTSVAAAKTIARLLSKDEQIKQENQRLQDVRRVNMRVKTRGGRPWEVRMRKTHPVQGRIGESGTILATSDVLRDLGSVHRFLEISAA